MDERGEHLRFGVVKDNLKIQIPPSLIINKRRKQHKNEPTTKLEPLLTGGGGLLVGGGRFGAGVVEQGELFLI